MRILIRLTIATMILAAFSPLASRAAEPTPGGTFVDDDTSIHQGSIEAISEAGITRGCNPPHNNRFCPTEPVTRGEMAAFLARALELPSAPDAGFTDTASSTFATDIDRLAAAKITVGCNPPANTEFCPLDTVTREQMAAFLARALGLVTESVDSFVDDDSSIFEADIEKLHAAGITRGCNPPGNDRFCPSANVTRAEMATFLARALELEEIEVTPRPYVLDVVSRDGWGAKPVLNGLRGHEIQQITIHHSNDTTTTTGPALYRIWQGWHQSLGWPDVAYHFIVGRDGNVFEGRPYWAAGDTATEYDPRGHFLIVVEGDYNSAVPSAQQLESVAQLVAWASTTFDVSIDTISGHRDHAATSCPGDNLYAKLHDGTIAGRAQAIVGEGGVSVAIGTP